MPCLFFLGLTLHRLPPQIQFQYRVVSLYICFIRLWQLCPETSLFFRLSVSRNHQKTPQGKLKNQLTSFWPQCKNSHPHCDSVSDTYQKKDDGISHVRSRVNLQIWGEGIGGCVAAWSCGCTADCVPKLTWAAVALRMQRKALENKHEVTFFLRRSESPSPESKSTVQP